MTKFNAIIVELENGSGRGSIDCYARKDQLVSKNIVPQATYDKIKDQLIAKQPKK